MSTRSTESGSDSGYSSRSHDSDNDNVESDDNDNVESDDNDSGYSRSHHSDHIGRLSDNDSTPVHGPSGPLSDETSPKRRRRKITTTVDRISELPDSVLAHLPSFVPVEDAIKTQVLSIMEAKGLRSPLLKCECLRLDTHIFQSVLPGIANLLESSPNLETFRVTTMSSSIYYENAATDAEKGKWVLLDTQKPFHFKKRKDLEKRSFRKKRNGVSSSQQPEKYPCEWSLMLTFPSFQGVHEVILC